MALTPWFSRSAITCCWAAGARAFCRLKMTSTSVSPSAFLQPASAMSQNDSALLVTKATLGLPLSPPQEGSRATAAARATRPSRWRGFMMPPTFFKGYEWHAGRCDRRRTPLSRYRERAPGQEADSSPCQPGAARAWEEEVEAGKCGFISVSTPPSGHECHECHECHESAPGQPGLPRSPDGVYPCGAYPS